jgi:hypothetical protein
MALDEMAERSFTIAGKRMTEALQDVHPLILLVIATTLEVSGDAIVRMAIYNHTGLIRIGLFLAGAGLLLGYGSFLNLAPLEFGRVVGLYIATLFVVWQVINFVAFRSFPTMPILVGAHWRSPAVQLSPSGSPRRDPAVRFTQRSARLS